MRGDVDTIKERLNIVELVSGYVKLEKAGASFKARCPFHNEKSPSFFVSPARQNFYCFGCGAKGDIFSFVEEMEGLDFAGALRLLAEKAGVEIEFRRGESKEDKEKLFAIVEEAAKFFEKELDRNKAALRYLASRGIDNKSKKVWRLGYAPAEWRTLYDYLQGLGYDKSLILKAGLAKISDSKASGEPYDVFRDRIVFPLADQGGRIIAFSGRALSKETEPKYLNSPDTPLFTKSEVLYGFDRAKEEIRRKDYAVLVEGQIDLVLSHQVGVGNTVAASGTAFTQGHLERLKRFSSRIIIAFDGDEAGEKAAERASTLGIFLGFEVKVAPIPKDLDPAELAAQDPQEWKEVLRHSLPAVEFFFNKIEEREEEPRKIGKQIEKQILPMIKLMGSAIEQSHFLSMLAKRTGIKEEILWEDLKKVKKPDLAYETSKPDLEGVDLETDKSSLSTYREQVEERLAEIKFWQKELSGLPVEVSHLKKEEAELEDNLSGLMLRDDLTRLSSELVQAEKAKDQRLVKSLASKIQEIHAKMRSLEEKKKIL